MDTKTDINSMDHIKLLVDTFYGKVQKDVLIGGIFSGVIKDWPTHLEKMYRFWQTVLLEEHTYQGSPFPPHAQLPVNQEHFDAWLRLWHSAIEELFEGPKAEQAKWRGDKMAVMFLSKIKYYRDKDIKPLM